MLAIEELKNLLLSEERSTIDTRFDAFRQEMLVAVNKVEKEIIDSEKFAVHLTKSKMTLIDILSPLLGTMIKKYVELEIAKINKRISNSTNVIKSKWNQLFSVFSDKNAESKLHQIGYPEIVEVLLVDKDSGLLLGKYSKNEKLDSDVIAGMFSAIKSFAESAFESSDNELELIHYQDYKIKIQGYGSIYFAIVFNGRHDEKFDEIVTHDVNNFIDTYYESYLMGKDKTMMTKKISELMNLEFSKTCRNIDQKLS